MPLSVSTVESGWNRTARLDTHMYDVIVIGGGPAGASAAYRLTSAGKSVVVLEKEALPRKKLCGGGIPAPVFELFDIDFSPVVDTWVRRVKFRYRGELVSYAELPSKTMAMVKRESFDAYLLQHSGAEVMQEFRVAEIRDDNDRISVRAENGAQIEGSYLIDASGGDGRICQLLGLESASSKDALAVVDRLTWDGTCPEMKDKQTAVFEFGSVPGGYIWMFPKSDHISAGAGMFCGGRADLKSIVRTSLLAEGCSASMLTGFDPKGTRVQLPDSNRRIRRGRILRVGEAAGCVDPLIGEGIRYAVLSGFYAAEAIIRGKPELYERRVRRHIFGDLKWAKVLARLFYGFPRWAFLVGVRNPLIVKGLVGILSGTWTYRKLSALFPLLLFTGLPYCFYLISRR